MTYQASIDENRTPFDIVVYEQDGVALLADRDVEQHPVLVAKNFDVLAHR